MAYTKIHAIKATVHKAITYICNPSKTDDSILVTSFGCSPETAHFDFKFALSKTNQDNEKKAYHLIQSFLPGEVSYDEAHVIGTELSDQLLEGKYNYILTTHIDKGHVHNHLIFCAADNIDHKKYNDCKNTYYHIRQLSDNLCKEHNLSTIISASNRDKYNSKSRNSKTSTSTKLQLIKDIDEAIKYSKSYDNFLLYIVSKGYEIKGESLENNSAKYISFRPINKEKYIRGSERTLGLEYTKEQISERIRAKKSSPPNKKSYTYNLIDTTNDKFMNSPGLKHWADIQNLKLTAKNYATVDSIVELEALIEATTAITKSAKNSLLEIELQMKELAEVIKYLEQYEENKKYNMRYQKAKDPDTYFRSHESKLLLFFGAKNALEHLDINLNTMDVFALRNEYSQLFEKKNFFTTIYQNNKQKLAISKQNLKLTKRFLNQYISNEHPTTKKNSLEL